MMVTKKISPLQHQLLWCLRDDHYAKQEELAKAVGSVQPAVNRSMRQLLQYGLLGRKGKHYYVTTKGQRVLEEWEMTPLQVAERRLQEIAPTLPEWTVSHQEDCEVAALEILSVYQQVMRLLQRIGADVILIDGQARVQMFDGKIPIAIINDDNTPRIMYQEELPVQDDEMRNVYIKLVSASHE